MSPAAALGFWRLECGPIAMRVGRLSCLVMASAQRIARLLCRGDRRTRVARIPAQPPCPPSRSRLSRTAWSNLRSRNPGGARLPNYRFEAVRVVVALAGGLTDCWVKLGVDVPDP